MEPASVLLVAKPGPLSNALLNLIVAIPQTGITLQAETGLLALKLMRVVAPQLVVIASSIADEETLELVRQVKQQMPATQCLVIVETPQQGERIREAGADATVASNISAAHLATAIEQRLSAIPRQDQTLLNLETRL